MVRTRGCILLVDDDSTFVDKIKAQLATKHRVVSTTDSKAAVKYAMQYRPDVMLLDLCMPDVDGFDILRHLKPRMPQLQIIILTGKSEPAVIVEAIKLGATDFVVKGADDFAANLDIRIGQALKLTESENEKTELLECLKKETRRYDILGVSSGTVKLRSEIAKFKGAPMSVLVTGENGSGKELVARQFNIQEGKPSRPFIEVNCGAIPGQLFESEFFGHVKGSFSGAINERVGKFELAHKGDIFLDEIGDLPLEMQVKLLRVLQEGRFARVGSDKIISVNVRVIAATNKNLENLVRTGHFREDLFYRLSQIPIKVLPLRERKADILHLAEIFCDEFMPGYSFTKASKELLERHQWRGNIRELKTTVERSCLLARSEFSTKIEPRHIVLSYIAVGEDILTIPAGLFPRTITDLTENSFEKCVEWMEKLYIKRGLELTHDDNNTLMDLLNLGKTVYYEKKKRLGLSERMRGAMA
jgi:DNA-binding NtrC family response regulator